MLFRTFIFLCALAASAAAQPVLITAPATLNPGATTITPTGGGAPVPLATAEITVRGTTLTVNGRHAIQSLAVESAGGAGIVTHAPGFVFDYSGGAGTDVVWGFELNIATDATIDAGCAIHADGLGFPARAGPGAGTTNGSGFNTGGSHGGNGGLGAGSVQQPGTYGSITQPDQFGSGGGVASNSAGGGVVHLIVEGVLTVNGRVSANGHNASGAGAGGSVWVMAGTLAGTGIISANGGATTSSSHGSGGAGRVAAYYTASTFSGQFQAHGGSTSRPGGAGSIYRKAELENLGLVLYDNNHFVDGRTSISDPEPIDADVSIINGAMWAPSGPEQPFVAHVLHDLTVGAGGSIHTDGLGFASRTGPGAGTTNGSGFNTGGSHGGNGGLGVGSLQHPGTYGSITQPDQFGSGGGNPGSTSGGGAVRLIVDGVLTVNGRVSANGQNAAGAGAGGSVWITTGTLAGTGIISANGGATTSSSHGSGGGGRVAVYFTANTFSGQFQAHGGSTSRPGGAGSIYRKAESESVGLVLYDNNHFVDGRTSISDPEPIDADVSMINGATWAPLGPEQPFVAQVLHDLTVGAGGSIHADGLGFASRAGPGAGTTNGSGFNTGGSHGGNGGLGSGSHQQPGTYGSITQPDQFGSGGGNPGSTSGGGAVRLNVDGVLTVNGRVAANGESASGAGAGGSVWITTGTLAGTGIISANGGATTSSSHGSGGGGRVAVYFTANTFSGQFQAHGGSTSRPGGAGSIYRKAESETLGLVLYDNNHFVDGRTSISDPAPIDADVSMINGATWAPLGPEQPFVAHVLHDLTVGAGCAIHADGLGFASRAGLGAGNTNGSGFNSGGGHGGQGGGSNGGGVGGSTYGSITQPDQFGSGGGVLSSSPGGGVVRLRVGGVLRVDGRVSANAPGAPGAGAGGSLFVEAGSLIGTGQVQAWGGNTTGASHGSGGGGRIGIFACARSLPDANISAAGGSGSFAGQPGSIYFGASSIEITSHPEGGDLRGGDYFQLNVSASSSLSDLTYQWRRRNMQGEFVPLEDGERGIFFEVNSSTLFIAAIDCQGAGVYDCLICDSCGCIPTNTVELGVIPPGDFNQDGGTDGADVEAFFDAWEAGLDIADINQDGGVDGADVDFFFYYWEQGC